MCTRRETQRERERVRINEHAAAQWLAASEAAHRTNKVAPWLGRHARDVMLRATSCSCMLMTYCASPRGQHKHVPPLAEDGKVCLLLQCLKNHSATVQHGRAWPGCVREGNVPR